MELIDNKPGFSIQWESRIPLISTVKRFWILQSFIGGVINTTSMFNLFGLLASHSSVLLLLENGLLRRNLLNLIANPYFETLCCNIYQSRELLSNYLSGLFWSRCLQYFLLQSLGLSFTRCRIFITIANPFRSCSQSNTPMPGPFLGGKFLDICGGFLAETLNQHWN